MTSHFRPVSTILDRVHGEFVLRRRLAVRTTRGNGFAKCNPQAGGVTWKEFLRIHWNTIAATDFLTVEVWTPLGLVRYHVLFVIRLMTREVRIAGIVPEPGEPWMLQMARNLADAC